MSVDNKDTEKATADLSLPVLVVDDHNDVVRMLTHALLLIGFEDVDQASDGMTALIQMRDRKYGLVISDYSMVPMDGLNMYQQLRGLKTSATSADVPFVVATGHEDPDLHARMRKVGIEEILIKPVSRAKLEHVIEKCLGPLPSEDA